MIVEDEILSVEESISSDTFFVGIGMSLAMDHAVIIIYYDKKLQEFDFIRKVELQDAEEDSYYKKITHIHPDEVATFLAYCHAIKKRSKPTQGLFYSGGQFNRNGSHSTDSPLGQRMSCVGFCLNVLKGFKFEDYLVYEDWKESSQSLAYLAKFCEKNNLDIKDISPFHRRITPIELLSSAFFDNLPIEKIKIDSIKEDVKKYFEEEQEKQSETSVE